MTHTKRVRLSWLHCLLPVLLGLALASLSRGQMPEDRSNKKLDISEIVRQYGRVSRQTPTAATPAKPTVRLANSSALSAASENDYWFQMASALVEKRFDDLEKAAREARTGKARLPGGVWKLYKFYDAVEMPYKRQNATAAEWTAYFATLKDWIAAYPESPTPRIALGEGYISYAWAARGHGYADSVSEGGWNLFNERVSKAQEMLIKAAQLKEKDPFWFEAMQTVALAQGWDKAQARELLDQAVASEPGYYHYYREHANFLLPKWYGQEGEVATFAEEVSNRVGGQEGLFLYFEIASVGVCQCQDDKASLSNLSWPKIKQGYVALEKLYGLTNLKNNRFAYMAYSADDKAAAQLALSRIGENIDPSVWRNRMTFQAAKAWATRP